VGRVVAWNTNLRQSVKVIAGQAPLSFYSFLAALRLHMP
jgi:hypothetical protein